MAGKKEMLKCYSVRRPWCKPAIVPVFAESESEAIELVEKEFGAVDEAYAIEQKKKGIIDFKN